MPETFAFEDAVAGPRPASSGESFSFGDATGMGPTPEQRRGFRMAQARKQAREAEKHRHSLLAHPAATYIAERMPFMGGAMAAGKNIGAAESAERIKSGEFDDKLLSEEAGDHFRRVAQYLNEQEDLQKRGFARKVGDTVAEIPGFATEFAATGGVYSAGKSVTEKVLQKLLGKVAEKGVGRAVAGVATRAAGVGAMTAANPVLVAENTTFRMLPSFRTTTDEQGNPVSVDYAEKGDPFADALVKGFGDSAIEIMSERAGGPLSRGAGSVLGRIPIPERLKAIKNGIAAAWIKSQAGRDIQALSKAVASKTGWNGVIGEVLEERVGDVARLATGLESPNENVTGQLATGKFSEALEQLAVEGLAFSVPGAASLAATGAAELSDRSRIKREQKAAQGLADFQQAFQRGQQQEEAAGDYFPFNPKAKPKPDPAPFATTPEYASSWADENPEAAASLAKKVADGGTVSRKDFTDLGLPEKTRGQDRQEFGRLVGEAIQQQQAQSQPEQPQTQPATTTTVPQQPAPTASIQPPPPTQAPAPQPSQDFDQQRLANVRSRLRYAQEQGVPVDGIAAAVEAYENGDRSGPSLKDTLAAINIAIADHQKRIKQEAQQQPAATEQPPPPPSTTEDVPPTNPDVRKPQLPAPAEVVKAFEDQYGENAGEQAPPAPQPQPEDPDAERKRRLQERMRQKYEAEQAAKEKESQAQAQQQSEPAAAEQQPSPKKGLKKKPKPGESYGLPGMEDVAADAEARDRFVAPFVRQLGNIDEHWAGQHRPALLKLRQAARDAVARIAKNRATAKPEDFDLDSELEDAVANATTAGVDAAPEALSTYDDDIRAEVLAEAARQAVGESWGRISAKPPKKGLKKKPSETDAPPTTTPAIAPITAPPGSPEKIKAMQERAEKGEPIFAPGDAGVKPGAESGPPPAPKPQSALDKAREEARAKAKAFADAAKKKLYSNPFDPELLDLAIDMTIAYTKLGIVKFREFILTLKEDIGAELTARASRYLRDAWDFNREDFPNGGYDESSDVEAILGERPEQPAETPATSQQPPAEETADATLSKRVAEWLTDNNGPLSAAEFFAMADEAYGGTRAEGTYGPSDAYDALESGVNQFLQDFTTPQVDGTNAKEEAASLANLVSRLPSQTNRSGEKVELQQFSTPPSYAYVAAWLANIKPRDVVLEPSAGVGGIAVHARNAGATVFVNDISKRRANLLQQLDVAKVFTEDAEQIANILPRKMPAPTVVVMNPPFSKAGTRMGMKKMIGTDLKHIDQALSLLAPNGRLVAIIGAPLHYEEHGDTQTFKRWFSERSKDYNIRANVMVGRDVYKGYGTTFPTRVLVIDKAGSTVADETVTGDAATLSDLITKLNEVRNDRATAAQQQPDQPAGEEDSPRTEGGSEPGPSIQPPTGDRGPEAGEDGGVDGGVSTAGPGTSGVDVGVDTGEGAKPDAGVDGGGKRRPNKGGGGGRGSKGGKSGDRPVGESSAEDATPEPADTSDRVAIENQAPESKSGELTDNLFEAYHPSKLKIPGAKPHPGSIVESAAMASVSSPDAKYSPAIPRDVIEKGLLSEVQLEPIVYGGQAHEEFLAPDKQGVSYRKGYMVGDGTGVGKGRIIAGFILDNFGQGRKKAIWVSKNTGLLGSARRDWKGIGQNPDLIMDFGKTELGAEIKPKSGVMFVTYGQVKQQGKGPKAGQSRLQQLVDWLGEDFDGVIAFDEAHMMSGAAPTSGSRGQVAPSQQGLAGLALQRALPKARVVYVTATAATEVNHLAYAERLGLWGAGTEFPGGMADFVAKIKDGGVAAMELVTLSMKALGKYLARSLSFNDGTAEGTVEFDRLQHTLTPEQRQVYDRLADAWQVTLNNFNAALGLTGANNRAKSAAMSQFWGSHQRFFNQVITSMQLPSVIAGIEKDIADGKSVVIQLTNTGEAQQERSLAGRQDGDDLSDFDTSPADVLINMVENSYPTQQYEDFIDENGNPSSRPVVDSNGNPVHNAEALAAKAQLLEDLASIQVPNSPIDGIIDHFGHEMVAEVTGRSRRIILMENDKGQRVKTENKRSKGFSSSAEISSFQDGKKQILIFSEAGGTGESFHADRAAKNQSKRKHYLLQAGWKAAAAVQGLGRTHRTNQAQAPEYVLVHTDLKGQKRFLSTIARRLSQLGALTKGQRQTGSQGMFSARDNLEGTEAKDALHNFFRDLLGGNIEAISVQDFEQQTGLKLRGPDGAPLQQLPTIRSFLNRLLSLRVDMQNAVFDEFDQRLSEQVRQAEADGTLDAGVENLVADRIEKVSESVAFTDPASGAEVKYVKLRRHDKTEPLSFEQEEVNGPIHYVRNNKTGNVFAVETSEATRTDPKTGAVHRQHRLRNQAGKTSTVDEEKIRKEDGYTKLYGSDARQAWNEAMKKLPEFQSADVHMLTGALLLVWNRLRGHTQVKRTVTDKGEQLLGRIIPSLQLAATLRDLGIREQGGDATPNLTPEQAIDAVFDDGAKLILSNDWKIKRSTVQGEDRIEIVGPNFTSHAELDRAGAFRETIASKVRYFIPVGENAANVLAAITASRPIIRVEGGTGDYTSQSAGMPATQGTSAVPFGGMGANPASAATSSGPIIPSMSLTAPAPGVNVRPIAVVEVIDAIRDATKAFGKDIPIRIGRFRHKALGIFKVFPEVVRLAVANDIGTAAHEIGHAVEKLVYGWKAGGPWKGPRVTSKMQRELASLGRALYGSKQPVGGYKREGFAEFMRLYITDPASAKAEAPQFFNWFEGTFLAASPAGEKAISQAQQKYQRYSQQGALNRGRENIVDPLSIRKRTASALRNIEDTFSVRGIWEEYDSLYKAEVEGEAASQATRKRGLSIREKPYTLAATLRGQAAGRVSSMVENGMIDIEGHLTGVQPLRDIEKLVPMDKRVDFTVLLWALRAKALLEDPMGPRNPGMSLEDANQIIQDVGTPAMLTAATIYHQWNAGVLDYAAGASATFAEAVKAIRRRDPGFYAPLKREFAELERIYTTAGGGDTARGTLTNRLKGSGRRILDPIQAALTQAEQIVEAAHDRIVLEAVMRLERIEGMGGMVERVPVDRVPAASRDLSQLIEEIADRLKNKNIELFDQNGNPIDPTDHAGEIVTFFAFANGPKPGEPIIPVWEGGSVAWYQVDPGIYTALKPEVARMGPAGRVIDWAFATPGRITAHTLRMGATGLNPGFAAIVNTIRDTSSLYHNTQSGASFPRIIYEMMKMLPVALADALSAGRVTNSKVMRKLAPATTDILRFADRVGIEMAQSLNAQSPFTRRIARRIFEGPVRRIVDLRNWIDYASDVLQFSDKAARAVEGKLLAEKWGIDLSQPITLEQSINLQLAMKQVTTDFSATGTWSKYFTQFVPFMRSQLQGPRAAGRALKRDPVAYLIKGMATAALAAGLWWRLKDEDWWEKLSANQKLRYFHIPVTWGGRDELLQIPVNQDADYVFGTGVIAALDSLYKQNPQAAMEWAREFIKGMNPVNAPPMMEEIYEQAQNKDSYFGTPIVPEELENRYPAEQYNENTPALAKWLGETTGISPMRIEHAVSGLGGGVARDALRLGSSNKEVESEPADMFMLGRLFVRGGPLTNRPKAIGDFYDLHREAEATKESVKNPETEDQRQRRLILDDARSALASISKLRADAYGVDERRDLMQQKVVIAEEAMKAYKADKVDRVPLAAVRKAYEYMEKQTTDPAEAKKYRNALMESTQAAAPKPGLGWKQRQAKWRTERDSARQALSIIQRQSQSAKSSAPAAVTQASP